MADNHLSRENYFTNMDYLCRQSTTGSEWETETIP